MKTQSPRTIRLRDYRPPTHTVDWVDLVVSLAPERTVVKSRLSIRPLPLAVGDDRTNAPLVLHACHSEIQRLALNGASLAREAYEHEGETLTLRDPPRGPFTIEATTVSNPSANKALQGLYLTKGVYCTQCEAEGFRRITPMADRPDVLARYRVRLEGCQREAPVLLSNGNLTERGTLPDGRHYAIWDDPVPKSSYLFALVAGDLGSIASEFVTRSGRTVDLRIYVERGKESRAHWAMDALKRAMRWDEERFGREYDLDQFNIVAVSHFNMGAMENKGLNIFNDRLVLASAETATDSQFEAIESVVAHEYFHNWTGNRTTCRDWFQLCLKEGLTVYRDQEFSAAQRSRTVQRIADVRHLRATQFPEDAGPLAHAVRPDSYIEVNNFYTATVYEKGAEVVRLLATMLGEEAFRAGMDLYFERHDGGAATVEDFIACFEAVSGRNLSQFMLWYAQAGTPELDCRVSYNRSRRTLAVTLVQASSVSGGGSNASGRRKQPMPMPIRFGLVGADGQDVPLVMTGGRPVEDGMLLLTEAKETFRFTGLDTRPAVSVLRGFSAPVRLSIDISDADLAFLASRDSDLFNRWQALQQLAMRTLLSKYEVLSEGRRTARGAVFTRTVSEAIADRSLEPAYRAELLRLPTVGDIILEVGTDVDPTVAAKAHATLMRRMATVLNHELQHILDTERASEPYSPDADSIGRRSLRNVVLSILSSRGTAKDMARLYEHYITATNMTDQAHALTTLVHYSTPYRAKALAHFFDRWQSDDLVFDTWFHAQALANRPSTLDVVQALTSHPQFALTSPNKVRALLGTFAVANPVQFHRPDGAGYEFIADQVLAIDRFNPQVAARLLASFKTWRSLEPERRDRARVALMRVARHPLLSRDVHEIVTKMWER